ncbi:MAG: nitroreductase [Pseudomonadota bacterium]
MTVLDAVRARISTRAFLPDEIPGADVRALLADAQRSPSGGNLQPWRVHVVTGAARQRVIDAVAARMAEAPFEDEGHIRVYPEKLAEPWRTRRFELGEAMYALLDIPREDKAARLGWLARNFEFFGAPVGLFFTLDTRFDRGQWAHLGMFMQTICLLAEERGLATCMQEAWSTRARTVETCLGVPETEELYCGMALGKADPEHPVNRLRADRAPLEEVATFHGA